MVFRKTAASPLEIELQKVASIHGFSPKVLWQDGLQFEMEKIEAPCLAETYGDEAASIPRRIWDQIAHILAALYECEGIEYIDITPFNFIEKDGKIWIIDFGHACYTATPARPENWFLREFLIDGEHTWNPDFK